MNCKLQLISAHNPVQFSLKLTAVYSMYERYSNACFLVLIKFRIWYFQRLNVLLNKRQDKTQRQKMYLWTWAPSHVSDQLSQSRSLISIFTWHIGMYSVFMRTTKTPIGRRGCSCWFKFFMGADVRRYVFSLCCSKMTCTSEQRILKLSCCLGLHKTVLTSRILHPFDWLNFNIIKWWSLMLTCAKK